LPILWGLAWTWSDFEANLSFELDSSNDDTNTKEDDCDRNEHGSDSWRTEQKIRILEEERWDEAGELGDSCCFGTRTVETGFDYAWKLHGGV
jgi:hypothetical protein